MNRFIRIAALLSCFLVSACATQITQTPDDDQAKLAVKFQSLALAPKNGAHIIEKDALEVGDIVLSTDDGLISFAIRLASMSPVSHAAIYAGEDIFVEAIADGVHQISIDELVGRETTIAVYRHPDLTGEQRKNLRVMALGGVGKRYNYIGVALQMPFMLTRRVCELPFLISNEARQMCYGSLAMAQMPLLNKETSFCSQYVLGVFRQAGVPLTEAQPHWISPRDLMHMRKDDVPSFAPHLQLNYIGHLKQTTSAIQAFEQGN